MRALGAGGALMLGATLGMAAAALRVPAVRGAIAPPGRRKRPMTRLLETGARLLQGHRPLTGFDIYLVGFHPMKDNPAHQCEAHHFCRQVSEDFMECVLFDGNTAAARLIGVEYIISEALFARLPAAERRYWHPHNGEILSGLLQAPGLPQVAERALMATKMNSYGKTWHLWDEADALPCGEARLMWSFNRLGELDAALLRRRDRRLGLDTVARRRSRGRLAALAHPQE